MVWHITREKFNSANVVAEFDCSLEIYDKTNQNNFDHSCFSLFPLTAPQQTPQRWINVEATLIVNVYQRFFNVDIWLKWKLSRRTFIDVVSTLAKQRWSNVYRITLIQRLLSNAISTLKFGWNWKLSRHMFIDIVSTLTKQLWWPNVVWTLIFGWKWKLNQRMFIGVASTLRKQHWNDFVNCCSDLYWCSLESGSKTKQN